MRLLCATICVILGSCVADYIDINACFVQRPGFEVSVRVNQVENTKTVQFKDDCLRECLKTLQDDTRRCRSIIHMPRDNDCIISDSLGQSVGRVGSTKVHNNYYENVCAQDPPGGRLWARLEGYKGSQGVVEVAQKKGKNPQIMVVMTGLSPGKDYDIFYAPGLESSVCRRMASVHNADLGQKLITVDSDSTGMGIQPWTEIDWHILDDDVPNKILVVAESKSGIVVDCGKLTVKGNMSDWEAALNTVPSVSNLSLVYALSALFALFFAF